MVELGDKIKDKITQFTGICVVEHEYTEGEKRFTVQPPIDKEGKIPDSVTFDASSLEILAKGEVEFKGVREEPQCSLGDKAKDKITKFEGMVVAKHTFFNGCVHFTLIPLAFKGKKMYEHQTFDHNRLEVIKEGVYKSESDTTGKPTGGPEKYMPNRNAG